VEEHSRVPELIRADLFGQALFDQYVGYFFVHSSRLICAFSGRGCGVEFQMRRGDALFQLESEVHG